MVIVQELLPRDLENRVNICRQLLNDIPATDIVMFSDEAHFHLSGSVNRQNFRYWSETNPRELHQTPLHSPRVTTWCAISSHGIIGPYFYEEGEMTVTVTADRYIDMLQNFLRPNLNDLNLDHVWFQQDGATAHTARRSMDVVRQIFPGKVISMRGHVQWPARSPDLTPCDFFLWGYLKAEVYKHRPRDLAALKTAIRQEIQLIRIDVLQRVMDNYRLRLQTCIDNGGRHLTDVLFKTT